MRRLGIDHGERRVGVAFSDDEARIAHPLDTLARKDPAQLIEAVAQLAREREVGEIVVGLPLSLDGREGASARRAKKFAERLEAATRLPIVLWDERLTSVAAERALADAGVRAKDRKGAVDRVAAALLLQSYLDSKRQGDEPWLASEPGPEPLDEGRQGRGRARPRSRER